MGMTNHDSAPNVMLSPRIKQAIIDAPQGDTKAWAILYAAAATFVASGVALPDSIRELMAARLQALSNALHGAQDARALLLDAVAPMPAGNRRPRGAKQKTMTLDKVAADVLFYKDWAGVSLKAASRKLAQLQDRYPAASLEAAAKKVRRQQQEAEKQQSTIQIREE